MAIDGINILESDFAMDIHIEILDLCDKQKSAQEINAQLNAEYQQLTETLDREIFVASACLTLWQIGMLDNDFLSRLKIIVNNGADKFWLNNFDNKNFERRNAALRKLYQKIQMPNAKIRKPKKYKEIVNSIFSKGDVLAIKIDNNYRCLIFENFYQYKNDAWFSFVATTYKNNQKPVIDNLLIEEIPVTINKSGATGIRKLDIYGKGIEKNKSSFIKIGALQIDTEKENAGFSRQIDINDLYDLENEIDDILLGNKTELYVCYNT